MDSNVQGGARLRYFGWSSLAIDTPRGSLFFDPFYRPYCGARWSSPDDYAGAKVVCVTHGHEEHFLDTPEIVRSTGATVVSSESVCRFLRRRAAIPREQLVPATPLQPVEAEGFRITTFGWKHRDISLPKAFAKAVVGGNATQLKWFWSSLTRAPFYAPYTGFHVELPGGATVLNYNEGFNTKMTDAEIGELGRRFRVDVLLAGMQLDFTADVARGVAALKPRAVVLYPPHEKFHEMMGARSKPWAQFVKAAEEAAPGAPVVAAQPGQAFELDRLLRG
jgi:L-ascorbate metabolism protein UlaG (beta-lactamase superfamily)